MLKEEKQSVRSRIKKAFIGLLSQKAYTDITVSDLVNKAQVARMSFYRNFNSIDDVINSIADDMIKNFNMDIAPVLKENDERKWRELIFEIIYRNKQMRKENGFAFPDFKGDLNYKIITDRVHEKILLSEYETMPKTPAEKYTGIAKISLLHGIIDEWNLSGMKEPPEEIVNIILSIIMKI